MNHFAEQDDRAMLGNRKAVGDGYNKRDVSTWQMS
jgi:hypothetical protein